MSYTNGPRIVTNGLVLCLDAGNTKSYSGSGTALNDLSGNNNTGTLTNGPSYNISNAGNIVFDGTNDFVNINHSSSLNLSNNFTVSVFTKVNTDVFTPGCCNAYNIITKKTSINNSNKGWICSYDFRTSGVIQLRVNDGVTFSSDVTPVSDINLRNIYCQTGTFVHSCWTLSGYNAGFYVNGIYRRTTTTNNIRTDVLSDYGNSVNINIGSASASVNFSLGSLSIYNRVLSASEILQNYNALKGRFQI
jgi:hypothetical protein